MGYIGEEFIKDILNKRIYPGMRILEIGCGGGFYKNSVKGFYVGTDVTTAKYRRRINREVDVVCSAHALPFKNNVFNAVFSVSTLDYIPDIAKTFSEANRVLALKGDFLIFTYNYLTLRKIHQKDRDKFGPDKHYHVYTLTFLFYQLVKFGFYPKMLWIEFYSLEKRLSFLRNILKNFLRSHWRIVLGVKRRDLHYV